MPDAFQFSENAQAREVVRVHAPHLEDVVRAHAHAISLRLATPVIDNGKS